MVFESFREIIIAHYDYHEIIKGRLIANINFIKIFS